MRSAFRSQSQKTIQIDGIKEEIIIQPLSTDARRRVLSIRRSSQRLMVGGDNSQAQNNADIIRLVVNDGIVSVGDETNEYWSDVLEPAAQRRIAKEIQELSRA